MVAVGAWRVLRTPSPYDLKILHFIPVYAPAWKFGGPVRSVSALAEEQARQGQEMTVLTTNADLAKTDYPGDGRPVQRNGVTVHYYEGNLARGIVSPALEEAVDVHVARCDILHITAIWQRTARAAHRAAAKYRKPVVVSPRGALGPYAWARSRLAKVACHYLFERHHLRRVSGFHYTSRQEAAESAPFGFGRPSCVLPNGFSEESWQRDEAAGSAWRTRLDIPREAKLLLYVGRIHHKKGLEILPEALSRVMAARGGAMIHLVLVGPDEDGTQGRLNEAARRAGFGGRMHWVSTVPQAELCAAYSAADLFVLPSLHENFGNSAIEALVCGCPALVSAETACLEYGAGLGMSGVAQRTLEAWTAAILSELDQSSSRLGARERATLMQRVGLPSTASAMVSFYESLL